MIVIRLTKNKKRGAELIESMLLIAITIALAFILFYPQISSIFTTASKTIETKFNESLSSIN